MNGTTGSAGFRPSLKISDHVRRVLALSLRHLLTYRAALFTPAQHFCVIVMSDVGVDLESAEIANWSCAVSVLYQVTSALAAAEREHRFEVRSISVDVERL